MFQCKHCIKFRASLNENGICDVCSKKNQVGQVDRYSFEKIDVGKTRPYSATGTIFTRDEWNKLKTTIDRYYYGISDEQIFNYNVEVRRNNIAKKQKSGKHRGYIYLLRSSVGFYKIGRAVDVDKRVREHLRSYPIEIHAIHVIEVDDAVRCESFLLKMFKDKRKQGEWFSLGKDEIDWIVSLSSEQLESLAKNGRKRG